MCSVSIHHRDSKTSTSTSKLSSSVLFYLETNCCKHCRFNLRGFHRLFRIHISRNFVALWRIGHQALAFLSGYYVGEAPVCCQTYLFVHLPNSCTKELHTSVRSSAIRMKGGGGGGENRREEQGLENDTYRFDAHNPVVFRGGTQGELEPFNLPEGKHSNVLPRHTMQNMRLRANVCALFPSSSTYGNVELGIDIRGEIVRAVILDICHCHDSQSFLEPGGLEFIFLW